MDNNSGSTVSAHVPEQFNEVPSYTIVYAADPVPGGGNNYFFIIRIEVNGVDSLPHSVMVQIVAGESGAPDMCECTFQFDQPGNSNQFTFEHPAPTTPPNPAGVEFCSIVNGKKIKSPVGRKQYDFILPSGNKG